MKILTVTLVALIIFSVIFWGLFYYSVRIANETATAPQATSTPGYFSARPLPRTNSSTTAPVDFHGPTSQPHIIGPSGNPPNY